MCVWVDYVLLSGLWLYLCQLVLLLFLVVYHLVLFI